MSLKTDYKDDKFSGKRKYRITDNGDGTSSLDDVTVYQETGDILSAFDVNAINRAVNAIDTDNTEFQNAITARVDAVANRTERLEGVIVIAVPASRWSPTSPYTQTVSVPGVTSQSQPVLSQQLVDPLSDVGVIAQQIAYGYLDRAVCSNGSITFYAYRKKPANNFTVMIKGA